MRFYERRRWRFNETASTIAASSGQSYITIPANFLVLDYLQLSYSGATNKLNRRDLDYILQMRSGASSGPPTDFCIYGNKIELGVIPDSAYACPLHYLKSLSALSASADTNAWTEGLMQDVIVYHATKLMYANVIRDAKQTSNYIGLEALALSAATSELEQFTVSTLKATRF